MAMLCISSVDRTCGCVAGNVISALDNLALSTSGKAHFRNNSLVYIDDIGVKNFYPDNPDLINYGGVVSVSRGSASIVLSDEVRVDYNAAYAGIVTTFDVVASILTVHSV